MNTNTWRLIGVILPPFLLGIVSFWHPHHLNATTAQMWLNIHLIQLPLFGLLGYSYYLLIAHIHTVYGYIARALIGIFVLYYTALDALAGVGNGILYTRTLEQNEITRKFLYTDQSRQWLFDIGNDLGEIGVYAIEAAAVLIAVLFLRKYFHLRTFFALLVFLAGTYLFGKYHTYTPWGTVGMMLLVVSMPLLLLIEQHNVRKV